MQEHEDRLEVIREKPGAGRERTRVMDKERDEGARQKTRGGQK